MNTLSLQESTSSEAVLILAPTGQDARLLTEVLVGEKILAEVALDVKSLGERLKGDVGAILIAEEALTGECLSILNSIFSTQEPWSDVPLVI
jgi:hypothetical protein